MIHVPVCPHCPRVLPPPADRCPVCGWGTVLETREGTARVIATTELSSPSEGWEAPHRIALVELIGGGRLLAVSTSPLPARGEPVTVVEGSGGILALAGAVGEPAPRRSGRGEGELPSGGAVPPGL